MKRLQVWFLFGVVAAWSLGGCGSSGGSGAVIRSPAEYTDTLARAQSLSEPVFRRFDAGETVTEADLRNLDEALELFDALIDYRPETFSLYVAAGRIHQLRNRQKEALEAFDQAAQRMTNLANPAVAATLAETHHLAAESMMAMQDFRSAAAASEKALKLRPRNPAYLYRAASIYIELRELERSKTYLRRALEIDPDYAPAKELLKFISRSGS